MALLRALSRRASRAPTTTTINPYLQSHSHRHYYSTSPDGGASGFFRRFFHRPSSSSSLPDFLSFPVGDRLRDRLMKSSSAAKDNNNNQRLHLDSILPPPPSSAAATTVVLGGMKFSVDEARKLLRLSQAERLKAALRATPETAIPYGNYVSICVENCGGNAEQGKAFARLMDESGDVIVIGGVVFIRPEQVVKTVVDVISQSMAAPNDPRRQELDKMEQHKAVIDKKACSLVRGELYCGLGFIVLQTVGFMRLTFWELSWDVMEPICFFVTSLHFAAGYAFFLRTSTEPSFEGFYKRRFKAKQMKVMEAEGFDNDKYMELCKVFNCGAGGGLPAAQLVGGKYSSTNAVFV